MRIDLEKNCQDKFDEALRNLHGTDSLKSLSRSWKILHELLVQGKILAQTSQEVTQLKFAKVNLKREIKTLLADAGLKLQVVRCQSIDGMDFITAATLVTAYNGDSFRSVNDYIFYINQSTSFEFFDCSVPRCSKGKVHPILLNAAMKAVRMPVWRQFYKRHRKAGRSPLKSYELLARRIARIAFSVLETQGEYLDGAGV